MDPQHRIYPIKGARYEQGRDVADTAALIRREIRLEANMGLLPRGRWSVKSKRFSLDCSIEVAYTPDPSEDELFAIAYYSRERIIFETENPHAHPPMPFRSEFGQLLEERIQAKLDEFNCHHSDKHATFFGGFYLTMKTQISHLKDLHRAGLLEQQPALAPALSYTAMLEVWRRERPPTPEESQAMVKAIESPGRHLRLVPPPPPVPYEVLERSTGDVPAPMQSLLKANAAARPHGRAKRRPIAVPVTDADLSVPETNEMWRRLALAEGLKLDWEIPGLKDRL